MGKACKRFRSWIEAVVDANSHLKEVTNEKGGAVGDVLTIIC